MSLHTQDWVEVRSKAEILRTLDSGGRLDNMPFMPEMFAYCGKKFRIHKSAHKSCDTINPLSSRSIANAVLLEGVRCSGAAHGGCQAACSIFWKEAWLKPVGSPEVSLPAMGPGCSEDDVIGATRRDDGDQGKPRYACQTTDFPAFSSKLRTRDVRQFLTDVRSGNASIGDLVRNALYFLCDFIFKPAGNGKKGAPFRWLYDRVQKLFGGVPYPRRHGLMESDADAPVVALNLQPGEFVRVRPYKEILKTIDGSNMNRGLYFDAELVPYCGGVFRVRGRVENFLDEKTGFMRRMRTPAVILEHVWCRGHFSNRRLLCPRAIYAWWREAWLERAPEATAEDASQSLGRRIVLCPERMSGA
jgi:hypothetical protein